MFSGEILKIQGSLSGDTIVRLSGDFVTLDDMPPPVLQPLRQRLRRDGFGDAIDERLGFAEGRLGAHAVVELVPGLHVGVVREADDVTLRIRFVPGVEGADAVHDAQFIGGDLDAAAMQQRPQAAADNER